MNNARHGCIGTATTRLAAVAILTLFVFGCVSSIERKRVAPYSPEIEARNPSEWRLMVANAGKAIVDPLSQSSRLLRRGDRLTISFRDIPRPEDIRDMIDDTGCINLPLIGTQKIEDKSSSDVETMLEEAYTNGAFYKKITVIVVPDEEEFFIRGEVNRQGRYPMSRDVTLLMAITLAGGYTDFASPSRIEIRRGNQTLTFNGKKIEKREEEDPLIKPGDIIVVPRGWT